MLLAGILGMDYHAWRMLHENYNDTLYDTKMRAVEDKMNRVTNYIPVHVISEPFTEETLYILYGLLFVFD